MCFCDYSIVYIYYAQCPEINVGELLWFAQHGKIHRISPVWYTRCHCTLPPWSLRERSLHRSGGREIQRQRHPMGRSKVSIWSRGDSCRICCRWNMMKPPGGMNCYCKCSLMLSIGIFWVFFYYTWKPPINAAWYNISTHVLLKVLGSMKVLGSLPWNASRSWNARQRISCGFFLSKKNMVLEYLPYIWVIKTHPQGARQGLAESGCGEVMLSAVRYHGTLLRCASEASF